MRRERRAVVVNHAFGVSVIGRQQDPAALRRHCVRDPAYAGVHGFHGLYGGRQNAGVSHHVTVGEVQDDQVVFSAPDARNRFVGHAIGAHLRLQIVGRDLGRVDQHAILARVRLLDAPVEEEGDMGVFLRFGDAQLRQTEARYVFSERVFERLRRIGRFDLRHRGVVARHRDEEEGVVCFFAREAVEARIDEAARQLAGAVRAEVEEYDGIAVLYDGGLFAGRADVARLHKLVALAGLVGRLDCGGRALGRYAGPEADRVVGLFDAIPAFVPVHRVVASRDRGDAADADARDLLFERREEGGGGARRCVATVQKGVDVYPLESFFLRERE